MIFLFSKESIFAVLLLSGTIKGILPLLGISGLPDLTLMSAIIVTFIMFYHMKETLKSISIQKIELISLLSLFYLFMIISLSYTSSENASLTKTINFGTMALAFYFPLFVKSFHLKNFILVLTIIIFITSVIFLNFYTSYLNRDEVLILNMGEENAIQMTALYLTISWLNGILVLYYFFKKNQVFWLRWFFLLTSFIFLISAGGRGPLIFVLLILGLYVLWQLIQSFITFKIAKLVLPIFMMIMLILSVVFIVFNTTITKDNKSLNLVDNTVMRLSGLVTEKGGGASAHSRIENAIFSIAKINENPFFGYGIGSYAFEKTNSDALDYPHNLFLEIWFELGYMPLFIFLFLFYRIYTHINSNKCTWCFALYFYFLLNVLKSSSLIDIRMMLGFYAIFITIKYIEQTEKNLINVRKNI